MRHEFFYRSWKDRESFVQKRMYPIWTWDTASAILTSEKHLFHPQLLIAMAKLSLQNVLTNFYIRIVTWRRGILVGADELGNQYYKAAKAGQWGRQPRWVIYAGEDEASMVPAEWHGWLHHRAAEPPTELAPIHRSWQKPHIPNKTGTEAAYRPPGHTLEGGHRARATGDYQPWTPS